MKTIKEVFRDAIEQGDWNEICRVFTAMTGEVAPSPPAAPTPISLLDQPMEDPLDRPMTPQLGHEMAGSQNNHLYGGPYEDDGLLDNDDDPIDEDDDDEPEEPVAAQPPIVLAAQGPPPADDDDPTSEFFLQQGTPGGDGENEDGERRCRREPMSIPDKRKNRFRDNGKLFKDEKVTESDDPALGIQKIRPRGNSRDKDLGADTGKTVDVVCGLCGKEESVAARLAVGYKTNPDHNTYRCNDCNSPNGRAKVLRKIRNGELNGGRRRRG